jgi:DNA mismatch repair protein MutL
MNCIKILPPDQAQKIAAGEVIERPANIVKELIENSLDAQATAITVYIEKAGKQRIRIIDNGCGMSSADARLCFLSHATSKITSIQELDTLTSFGFRGEALASVAAISKVHLITRQMEAASGVQLTYTAGTIHEEKEVACNVGTDLSVADLFYNIPVRKKFLKQDETEWNQILSLFYAFCMSNPSIFFKLFHNDKLILNAPPTSTIKDRITQLWDYNFSQYMIGLPAPTTPLDWLSITGYISNHHFWRYGKNNIFFFVNNRWIKNTELSKALIKGYYNVLPPGKFPAACIMITINKNLVDINCHPKKEEVRFVKPATIETTLTALVKQALEQNLSQKIGGATDLPYAPTEAASCLPQPVIPSYPDSNLGPALSKGEGYGGLREGWEKGETLGTIIGQLFNTYIIIENDKELVLIDQHAAHERILYEKFLNNFEHKEGTQLLFPEIVPLTKEHITLLIAEKTFFAHQGLDLEQVSSTEIIIKTAPPQLHQTSLKEFLLDAAAFMEEHEQLDRETFRKKLNEHMHSHMACKAAIKAGDTLTTKQMQMLVQNLCQTEKRFICIHGRPTMWSIGKEEIEKHFRRR